MSRKFVKKPIVIEAFRFGHDIEPPWIFEALCERSNIFGYTDKETGLRSIEIRTLEGVMTANEGDYVIKGIKGEIYPCKEDVFNLTYEEFYE